VRRGNLRAWGFDDTQWTGNNTGDACALFDTDGDGSAQSRRVRQRRGAGGMQAGNPEVLHV
jgi:hypothetical protein